MVKKERLQVFLGSDHAGFRLKNYLKSQLEANSGDYVIVDCGTLDDQRCDYPVFAKLVAQKVAASGGTARGLLVCGSGIGVAITANKCPGIRAATVWDATSARLCREHNDANVLCLGQRLVGEATAWEAAEIFLKTEFAGGRHQDRVELINQLDEG